MEARGKKVTAIVELTKTNKQTKATPKKANNYDTHRHIYKYIPYKYM